MSIGLVHYLTLAVALFTIGAIGVVVRRNALTVLMSIELMLNAANLTFVAFSRFPLSATQTAQAAMAGHASAFFVIAVAAAEAAVGLAILIAVFRKRQTVTVDELTVLRDGLPTLESLGAPATAETHAHAHGVESTVEGVAAPAEAH